MRSVEHRHECPTTPSRTRQDAANNNINSAWPSLRGNIQQVPFSRGKSKFEIGLNILPFLLLSPSLTPYFSRLSPFPPFIPFNFIIFFFLSPPPFLLPLVFYSPLPFPRAHTLSPARAVCGSAVGFPSKSRQSPAAKRFVVHFELKPAFFNFC